jgi:hypothetical protein
MYVIDFQWFECRTKVIFTENTAGKEVLYEMAGENTGNGRKAIKIKKKGRVPNPCLSSL